jgi:serine/threonine-protein kinase
MSETNSLDPLEQASDEARPAEVLTRAADAGGPVLFERLGVGGMGEVYRCGDDALGRDLALKVLRSELHGNADAQERFLREARLTGSLQHPGIVPIHTLSRLADGRPCYTMKLVRGRTLADMLRDEPDGPERLPRLLAVLEKVYQAVAFAHSRGVIHRDLKPANVMVGEFGEVQVMDWGLAKELHAGAPAPEPVDGPTEAVETAAWVREQEGLSRAGTALGTPSYMPPEQAAGDWAIVDERADVFALGPILCQILTDRPPYAGSNRDEVLRRARRGDLAEALARLEGCGTDAALVEVCRECLAPEREGRPRQAGVVADRLAAYQAEVQERLRQAELERARAEVQALEER